MNPETYRTYRDLPPIAGITTLADAARIARDRYGTFPVEVARLFRLKAVKLRAKEIGLEKIEVVDRQMRLHLSAGLPQVLMSAKVPEIVHVQPEGKILVVFVKGNPDGDAWLGIICRMLGLDLGWLGAGY